jgi:hypothetical protein
MSDATITTRPARLTAAALLQQARRNARATRQGWAALADALFGGRERELVLSDRERAILLQLLRQIVGDIDAAVRWRLDAQLEGAGGAVRTVWARIAADDGALTFTTMLERGLLRDAALMEAVAHRLWQHQLERAVRPPDRGRWRDDTVLERPGTFLDLPIPESSPLSRRIAAYMVDRSRRTDGYGNPVLLPGELEPGLYARLHWRVAAVLRDLLTESAAAEPGLLDPPIEAAASEAVRHSAAGAAAPTSAAEAAAALQAAGLLTPETLMRLLRAGEIPLFEAAFARLAGLRTVLLRRLLYERDGEGIAVLARALGLERAAAQAVCARVRAAGTGFSRGAGDEAGGPDRIFDEVARAEAEQVRAYWARSPDFTHALWELETGEGEGAAGGIH